MHASQKDSADLNVRCDEHVLELPLLGYLSDRRHRVLKGGDRILRRPLPVIPPQVRADVRRIGHLVSVHIGIASSPLNDDSKARHEHEVWLTGEIWPPLY